MVLSHATPPVATWRGIFPAALTMFDAVGRLDIAATRDHAADLVDRGAHGIVSCGTSGEFVAMSDDERLEAIAAAVEGAAGRVPVIAGTGAYSTDATVRLTREAAQRGADAALVILPYYLRPSVTETLRHFETVGADADIPIFVYNNPTNSAADPLPAELIGELAKRGLAHGVKSTFPTVHQVHEVANETQAEFRTFYGSFMAPLEGMYGGACGWISGILNVVVEDAATMYAAIEAGDLEKARATWRRILPYKYLYTRHAIHGVGDLALWRAVLLLQDRHGGHCRAPLRDVAEGELDVIREHLASRSTE